MKTISLIYGYSAKNAGDFAITLGAIDILRELGCRVKLFSRYRANSSDYIDALSMIRERYGEGIDVYECPFSLDRSASTLSTLKNYVDGMLTFLGLKRQTAFKKALIESDFIIFNGGNLFRCQSFIDFTRLTALLYPLVVARKSNKQYLIFPQSASTINSIGRKMLIPVLDEAQKVMIREKESYQYLSALMGDRNFFQTIDLAFFIKKDTQAFAKNKGTGKIALTMRFHNVGDISYLSKQDIDFIFKEHEYIIHKLREIGKEPIIVIQTKKDKDLSIEFAHKHGIEVCLTNNVNELLALYAQVDMLIGMRLHSIILALSVGTPCIGLFYRQWGLKNPGLMQLFNLPYFFYDERPKETQLSDAINKLLSNHSMISSNIKKVISDEKNKLMNEIIKIIR